MATPYVPPNTTGTREVVLKQNDTAPKLQLTLRDGNGDLKNLIGASAKICGRHKLTRELKISGTATVTGTTGLIEYQWQAADTDTAGIYELEVEVTYSDATVETFPSGSYIQLRILGDVSRPHHFHGGGGGGGGGGY